jgi:hypothetical protein
MRREPAAAFFTCLEHELDGAAKLVFHVFEQFGSAEKHGRVGIVAAHVSFSRLF